MRRLIPAFVAVAILSAPAIAGTPVPWAGPGWYVLARYSPDSPSVAASGPHADRGACEAVIAQWRAQDSSTSSNASYWCSYETVAWADPSGDEDW